MALDSPVSRSNGTSTFPLKTNAAHNFARNYYKHVGTGDVRVEYDDLSFTGTGGGEVIRARGIASGLLCATGATINAIHATGRIEAAKTVSGSLNAIRATLEIAGTTPTPGGTLAALNVDSNIVSGTTLGATCSFIKVTQSGTNDLLTNLLCLPAPAAASSVKLFVASSDKAATHMVKCVSDAGVTYWLLATTNAPS